MNYYEVTELVQYGKLRRENTYTDSTVWGALSQAFRKSPFNSNAKYRYRIKVYEDLKKNGEAFHGWAEYSLRSLSE